MLKRYESKHLDACAKLFYELFTSEAWGYSWVTLENTARYFNDLHDTPGFRGFVYFDGGELIGACLGCVSDYFSVAQYEIKEIFVDIKKQRTGHGSRMLTEIEDELRAAGVDMITLFTQKEINAFEFYKKKDYQINPSTVHFIKVLNGE